MAARQYQTSVTERPLVACCGLLVGSRILQVAGCQLLVEHRWLEVACSLLEKDQNQSLAFHDVRLATSNLLPATCNLLLAICNHYFRPIIVLILSSIRLDDIGIPVVRLSLITSFRWRCPIRLASWPS
jgi:hypothetical protein